MTSSICPRATGTARRATAWRCSTPTPEEPTTISAESVFSLGDISLGVGYAVPHWPLSNDGLAIRGSVKLPTGDESALAGSGGYSASLWAETSGALPGSDRLAELVIQREPGSACRRGAAADFRTLAATLLPSDTLA